MAMRLQDLVLQVPRVLQMIHTESLGPLLATCTELRQHVHLYVTKIFVAAGTDILQLSTLTLSDRSTSAATPAFHLGYNAWPQLKVLDMTNSRVGPAGIAQLIQSNLGSLQQLELQGNSLGSAGIKELIKGNWPQLISLNLQRNNLNAAALSELASRCWSSLTSLSLGSNKLSAKAISQLSKGSWPNLRQLDVSTNYFTHEAVSHIVSCQLPQLLDDNVA